MNSSAENFQPDSSTSTDGLEQLFDTTQDTVQDDAQKNSSPVQDSVHDDAQDTVQDDVQEFLSAKQAAKLLGIDRRSVVRLVNWQKLKGLKDNRGRWQISKESVLARLERTKTDEHEDYTSEVQDTVQDDAQKDSSHVQGTAQGHVQDTVQVEIASSQQASSNNELLTKAVLDMSSKLEAANYRVGYLEAQLVERDTQIKLLTDTQSKTGKWHQFINWFMGQ